MNVKYFSGIIHFLNFKLSVWVFSPGSLSDAYLKITKGKGRGRAKLSLESNLPGPKTSQEPAINPTEAQIYAVGLDSYLNPPPTVPLIQGQPLFYPLHVLLPYPHCVFVPMVPAQESQQRLPSSYCSPKNVDAKKPLTPPPGLSPNNLRVQLPF